MLDQNPTGSRRAFIQWPGDRMWEDIHVLGDICDIFEQKNSALFSHEGAIQVPSCVLWSVTGTVSLRRGP